MFGVCGPRHSRCLPPLFSTFIFETGLTLERQAEFSLIVRQHMDWMRQIILLGFNVINDEMIKKKVKGSSFMYIVILGRECRGDKTKHVPEVRCGSLPSPLGSWRRNHRPCATDCRWLRKQRHGTRYRKSQGLCGQKRPSPLGRVASFLTPWASLAYFLTPEI